MTTEAMVVMFALMGLVIIVSALLSGFIERSNFPPVAAFLGIGAVLGPHGLGVLNIGLDTPILRVVATLSLALVLFTDALTIDLKQIREHARIALIILGPGTLLVAALITAAAVGVLGLTWPTAAVLAASLASTDLVLLRGLLRRPDLPPAARSALRLESSMNDVVLLPIVLIGMAFAISASGEAPNAGMLLVRMLIVGPGIGAIIALAGVKSLGLMRSRVGVRRDYESLYSLGLAMAAFAAAEALHGSGFLAAFAAGMTIAVIDIELCDCFREYGETTAEMLLLFTFVLLGASLIWTGFNNLSWPLIGFVVLALAARPLTLWPTLALTPTQRKERFIISWFGPRGLSTLLLILVAVFEGIKGSQRLFEICSLVVVVSVVVHGFSLMALIWKRDKKAAVTPRPLVPLTQVAMGPENMSVDELKKLMAGNEKVFLLDVRSDTSYHDSDELMVGAIRVDPQQARRTALLEGVPKDAWAALFCT